MDSSEDHSPNRNELKPEIMLKVSDFSIDHILNKAGGNSVKQTNQNSILDCDINSSNSSLNYEVFDKNYCNYTPILNWLNYTRYRPPKLPRPAKMGPVKRTPGRLPRVPFTPFQLSTLEEAYKQSNYLSSEDANKLAVRLDLTCTRVKIWFQNRRARERRECRETILKSNSSSNPSQSHTPQYNIKYAEV